MVSIVRAVGSRLVGLAVVAGAAAAVAAVLLDPTVALAALLGVGVAGGLLVIGWLRARLRRLENQVATIKATTVSSRDITSLGRRVRGAARTTYLQLEALQNLYAMLPVSHRMPATRYWYAAAPDLLLLLVSLVRQRQPATIVELGTGASTVWTALALRHFGLDGRILSYEHDTAYSEIARNRLRELDLEKHAEIRHVPLVDLELAGETFPWYDRSAFHDVASCDLLFVDGPPGRLRRMARYPALPVLGQKVSVGGLVVADDYNRAPEQEMVRRWLAELDGWALEEAPVEKGAAILTRMR